MPATQRKARLGVIEQLLKEPHRFNFFHAVRLLERLLIEQGVPADAALTEYLQFQNSTSLSFPASQIESLCADADGGEHPATEAALLAALATGQLARIRITPSFIGLLGHSGLLPAHYTDRIAAAQQTRPGASAFLDLFSNRMVALFYQAWRKHRPELPQPAGGQHPLLPLLLSLSGAPPGRDAQPVSDRTAAYYTAAFRQRPVAAAVMEKVLADYLRVPVQVEPNLGLWYTLTPGQRCRLGGTNARLGVRAKIGSRCWRRDLQAGIRLGPLSKARFDHFLPGGEGAAALRKMLSMFELPTMQFEVRLVLRAADVRRAGLGRQGAGRVRLGRDAFLLTGPADGDRDDTHYLIRPL
ncbi:type VI secretion system baseplate subunit TssG [Rugamonas sp. CCM 8940]|uniref:type VI secretion system baseplate subunit TssG n=1 Tax=Rugamonas sp. CCM 8940 TaxID=2765359 RepID=UPI0018F72B99|nr:type VI secretion system baseplate subunit TssG [Rugamonas sp. CCM 8940]MBJ7310782.1 type VI secretion system baseplate subunit TssG [Rugamonas sp. CCM 8940]